LEKVDTDGSGYIDYSEWVVATINKHKLLSKEKLQAAFALFDKDGSGTISAEEVKEFLFHSANPNDVPDDEEWDRVIR
jgi:calcium-dependent protein kinase